MHPTDAHLHIGLALSGIIFGGGGVRFLIYVAKKLPPLGKDAGWWAQFAYNLVQGLSGLDPNSAIVTQSQLKELTGVSIPAMPEP